MNLNNGICSSVSRMFLSDIALLLAVNRLGIRNALVYILLGMFLWLAILKSGIHATIAGVILAMTIGWTILKGAARGRRP